MKRQDTRRSREKSGELRIRAKTSSDNYAQFQHNRRGALEAHSLKTIENWSLKIYNWQSCRWGSGVQLLMTNSQ
jgi:hypothetical protein